MIVNVSFLEIYNEKINDLLDVNVKHIPISKETKPLHQGGQNKGYLRVWSHRKTSYESRGDVGSHVAWVIEQDLSGHQDERAFLKVSLAVCYQPRHKELKNGLQLSQ